MPRYLLLLLLLGKSFAGVSQDSVIWKKTYGHRLNDIFGRCIGTSDKGYLLHGQIKRDVVPVPNGFDWGVYKLDSCGNKQWEKILFPSVGLGEICTALETPDGGYVVAGANTGNTLDFPVNYGGTDPWIIKLDHNGNVLWRKNMSGSPGDDQYYSSLLLPDGSMLFGGWYNRYRDPVQLLNSRNFGRLTHLDKDGNILWDDIIDTSVIGVIIDICLTPENKILVVGHTVKPLPVGTSSLDISQGKMAQYSMDGQLEWNITIGGPKEESIRKVISTTSNIIYITGFTNNSNGEYPANHGGNDIMLYKYDGTGHKIWGKLIGGSGNEEVHDMKFLNDSTLIMTGLSNSADGDIPVNKGNMDAFILKADTSGRIRELINFGGTGFERAYSLAVNTDHSYVIAGYSGPTDILNVNGIADLFIAKFKNIPYNNIDTFICQPVLWKNIFVSKDTSVLVTAKDICGSTISNTLHNFFYRPVQLSTIKDTAVDAGTQLPLFTQSNAAVTWQYSADLNCLHCTSPVAHPNTTAVYITTAANQYCTASDTVNVYVKERSGGFFIPLAFTPNHDGINDLFRVFGNAKTFSMIIYNRWGQPVFSSTQLNNGWNGEFKGSLQPTGAYAYIIKYQLKNDTVEKIQKGQVMLLR